MYLQKHNVETQLLRIFVKQKLYGDFLMNL